MKWLFFSLGLLAGGMLGVTIMCLCVVSGRASRMEEQMSANSPVRDENE